MHYVDYLKVDNYILIGDNNRNNSTLDTLVIG